jgi:glycosyltransferase involved in cell wall biosynthesis
MHTSSDFLDFLKIEKPCMYNNKYTRNWYLGMFNVAANNVDKIVVLSEVAFRSFNWIPTYKLQIIYNGIEDITLNKHKSTFEKNNKINFVCVASVNDRKGQKEVIEAISMLTIEDKLMMNFYIIGDGPNLDEYKEYSSSLNLNNVFFLGERSDVPNLLPNMDVFILASKAEGLPISIIEALRAGLYIMTTDVGGCKEMINDKIGEIIKDDPKSIAKSISNLVKNGLPNDIRNLSNLQYKRKFTFNKMINSYANLINQI